MKRSEAVKLIKNVLCEVTYDNIAESRANTLLLYLLKAGFRPPSFMFSATGEFTSWKEIKDGYDIDGDFAWEPEDEEQTL